MSNVYQNFQTIGKLSTLYCEPFAFIHIVHIVIHLSTAIQSYPHIHTIHIRVIHISTCSYKLSTCLNKISTFAQKLSTCLNKLSTFDPLCQIYFTLCRIYHTFSVVYSVQYVKYILHFPPAQNSLFESARIRINKPKNALFRQVKLKYSFL